MEQTHESNYDGERPEQVKRPTLDELYLSMLQLIATRGTCVRRKVACIITDKGGRVLSTGYNGPPRGLEHCITTPCLGALDPSGDTSRCEAVHAEQNALLQLEADFSNAHTMYVSCLPCFICARMICNTSIQRIVYGGNYADAKGIRLILNRGIKLERM